MYLEQAVEGTHGPLALTGQDTENMGAGCRLVSPLPGLGWGCVVAAQQGQVGGMGVTSHLRNWTPVGPRAMTLLARPSSSASGGGVGSFWGFTRRQVMRVGAAHVRGGTTTLRPLCLLPRMEPPRASTMKLTRNLGHSGSVLASPGWASRARAASPSQATHPVCTGLATGLMLSEVSVAGLLGISESSSYSLDACRGDKGQLSCHPRATADGLGQGRGGSAVNQGAQRRRR